MPPRQGSDSHVMLALFEILLGIYAFFLLFWQHIFLTQGKTLIYDDMIFKFFQSEM